MMYIIALVVVVVIGGVVAYTTSVSTPETVPEESPRSEVAREAAEETETVSAVVTEPDPEPVVPTTPVSTDTVEEVVEEPAAVAEPTSSTMYEDGSYSSTVSYRSPGGNHGLTVDLEIEDDQVVAADIEYETANGTSRNYLQRFEAGYEAEVVGQSLAAVSVSRVGGASLTATAFNKAVAEIKSSATR